MQTSNTFLDAKIIDTAQKITHVVIWLHGLGADGNDFVSIINDLNIAKKIGIRFIFPHAPQRAVTINDGFVMPAWYDIISANLGVEATEKESDILTSVTQINQLIQQQIKMGIPAKNIILAGFSQGGVIALQTGLRFPQPIAGIIALSTYLPFTKEALKQNTANDANDFPIFSAHGTYDPVIPYYAQEKYTQQLKQANFMVTQKTYPIAHSVSVEEITDINKWLTNILK